MRCPPARRALRRLLLAVTAVALLLGGLGPAPARALHSGVDGDTGAVAAASPTARPERADAAAPGRVEGTVTTPDATPVDGLLEVYQWNAGEAAFGRYDAEVRVDARPSPFTFSVALAPGTYYVRFEHSSDTFLPGYPGAATLPPTSSSAPGTFSVSSTAGATVAIALRTAPAVRRVAGVVRGPAGQPLGDIEVEAVQLDGEGFSQTVTDDTGGYALSLRQGSWELTFTDESGAWVGTTTSVAVGAADVSVPPTVLAAAGSAAVTGRVLDAAGRPLAGALAELHLLYDSDPDTAGWEGSDWVAETTTDAEGRYRFAGVVAGEHYTVAGTAPGHRFTVIGGHGTVERATGFPVADTDPVTAPTLAPDLTLRASSRVSGTVTDASGAPAAGIEVVLLRWDAGDAGFYSDARATTDGQGRYDFASVEPGDLTLRFLADPTSTEVDSAWLVGTTAPTAPGAAGTFVVSDTPQALTHDRALPRPVLLSGVVRDASGAALPDVTVTAYPYIVHSTRGAWEQGLSATTGADGRFRVRVPRQVRATLRFSGLGHATIFLSGSTELPASPDGPGTVDTGEVDLDVGTTTLTVLPTTFGALAGQSYDYCREQSLPLAVDTHSDPVPLPASLPVRLGDVAQPSLVVNSNGTVSFGAEQDAYTPFALSDVRMPMIAAFWADWDPTGYGRAATYGFSPDGDTFCAVWADGGYYHRGTNRLNTVQLLVRSAQGQHGRAPGDVDLVLNYDQVQWETGGMSGGTNGRGGTSAVVGWTAGTGAPGSYVQHPGSLVNGGLLDNNWQTGLIRKNAGSTQKGRYVYEVRNSVPDPTTAPSPVQQPTLAGSGRVGTDLRATPPTWDLPGTTTSAPTWLRDGAAIPGATGDSYRVVAADLGTRLAVRYTGTAAGRDPGTATSASVTATEGAAPVATTPARLTGSGQVGTELSATAPTWDLAGTTTSGPTWLRDGVAIAGAAGSTYRVVTADDGHAIAVRYAAARAGHASGTSTSDPVRAAAGAAAHATEAPAVTGEARVGGTLNATSGVWSAPGLTYTYRWLRDGSPVSGTQGAGASYAVVPGDLGRGLSVLVTASRAGYADGQATSDAVTVAEGAAAQSVTGPQVSGSGRVGESLTATPGTWDAAGLTFGYRWLRDGTAIAGSGGSGGSSGSGASYALVPADVGAVLTVRVTASRAGYADGVAVGGGTTGVVGAAATATALPSVTGTPRVGQRLAADRGSWDAPGLAFAYQWLRDGAPVSGAAGAGATYDPLAADLDRQIAVRVTATREGYAAGTATSAATTVVAGSAPVAARAPRVTGPGRVGTTLSAATPTWDVDGTITGAPVWLRDGIVLTDAGATTYQPGVDDLGHEISVRYTGTLAGHADGVATSAPVAVVAGVAARSTEAPTLSGNASVGGLLSADPGSWDADGLYFTYRWRRDGREVADATGPTYAIGGADAGRRLTVEVTATRPAHDDGVASSTALQVARVASRTQARAARSVWRRSQRGVLVVDVRAPDLDASPTGRVLVRDRGRVVQQARVGTDDGRVRVRLPRLSVGRHRLSVRYLGDTQVLASGDRVRVRVRRR